VGRRRRLGFLRPSGCSEAEVSTIAGTNAGTESGGAAKECRRACRRHVNNGCGVSPCRRATSEITALGTSVSSMILALSSSENRRRRPVPVITSSRRTPVACGSSVWSSFDTSRSPIQRSSHSPITDDRKRWGQGFAYPPLGRERLHLSVVGWPIDGAGDEVKMGTRGSFSEGCFSKGQARLHFTNLSKPNASSIVIKRILKRAGCAVLRPVGLC
jgi:hypothetical protein